MHRDPVLLQRILLKFVSNAIRYTGQGASWWAPQARAESVIAVWIPVAASPKNAGKISREFVQSTARTGGSRKGWVGLAIAHGRAAAGSRVELNRYPVSSMLSIRLHLPKRSGAANAVPIHLTIGVERDDVGGVFAIVSRREARARMAGCSSDGDVSCLAGGATEALARSQARSAPELIICDYQWGPAKTASSDPPLRAASTAYARRFSNGSSSPAVLRAAKTRAPGDVQTGGACQLRRVNSTDERSNAHARSPPALV